jgi:mono/diheme cytochrome c family protein
MTTNDPPTPSEPGPVSAGATVFGEKCASCHGASGQGNNGPQLSGGSVLKTFATPKEQVRWVMLGTEGYRAENKATYGDINKPVGGVGVMPAWATTLTPADLLAVVRHERSTLSGEAFTAAAWDDVASLADDPNPAVSGPAKEFKEILDTWKTLPPGS